MKTILGFDPGRDKCGVAVMTTHQELLDSGILPAAEVLITIPQLCATWGVDLLVMGNQTMAITWQEKLQGILPASVKIVLVDERYSTLAARSRYWQIYPPQGLNRLIPEGMRIPPRPLDDLVAIILIERYLSQV